jgi:hypothetical protein
MSNLARAFDSSIKQLSAQHAETLSAFDNRLEVLAAKIQKAYPSFCKGRENSVLPSLKATAHSSINISAEKFLTDICQKHTGISHSDQSFESAYRAMLGETLKSDSVFFDSLLATTLAGIEAHEKETAGSSFKALGTAKANSVSGDEAMIIAGGVGGNPSFDKPEANTGGYKSAAQILAENS